jgi:hypothetical protein
MATKTIKLRRELLSLTTWHDTQQDVGDESNEPSTVLERQVTELAQQLGCTETMAQRILFGQIPNPLNT